MAEICTTLRTPLVYTSVEQGNRRRCMDRFDILAAAAMEDSGAIDDSVDADESRPPDFRQDIAVEISGYGLDRRQSAAQAFRIANGSNHLMPPRSKTRQELAADEAICAAQ